MHHPHVELTRFDNVGFRNRCDLVIWGRLTKPQCQTIAVHNRGQVTLHLNMQLRFFSSKSIAEVCGHTYPSDLNGVHCTKTIIPIAINCHIIWVDWVCIISQSACSQCVCMFVLNSNSFPHSCSSYDLTPLHPCAVRVSSILKATPSAADFLWFRGIAIWRPWCFLLDFLGAILAFRSALRSDVGTSGASWEAILAAREHHGRQFWHLSGPLWKTMREAGWTQSCK